MADVNQLITLGIGVPSDIPHLVLFGLGPTGPVITSPAVTRVDAVAVLATAVDAVDRGATAVDAVSVVTG